jgi:hypothetical protein
MIESESLYVLQFIVLNTEIKTFTHHVIISNIPILYVPWELGLSVHTSGLTKSHWNVGEKWGVKRIEIWFVAEPQNRTSRIYPRESWGRRPAYYPGQGVAAPRWRGCRSPQKLPSPRPQPPSPAGCRLTRRTQSLTREGSPLTSGSFHTSSLYTQSCFLFSSSLNCLLGTAWPSLGSRWLTSKPVLRRWIITDGRYMSDLGAFV